MSFTLRLRSSSTALRLSRPTFTVQRAAFGTTTQRWAGKESDLHKAQDGRAEEAEKAKQDQLQDQKEGKGHWVDELASDSESAVKADRGEGHTAAKTNDFQKLQEATKHVASDKHN